MTTTKAKLVLSQASSVPPLMSLWLGQTGLLALVGLFLLELTTLEVRPTLALERLFAVVAVVKPVVMSLSPILD
jgi:hypothetical protein